MRQTSENVSPKSNEGRNRYVIEHITAALIELMEKYPFDEISISQICQEAQVGRASFYRNYESKKDILGKHMDALIQEWGKEFEERGDPNYFSESLLKHYYKYKDFYLLLYRHGLSDMIYETIRSALKMEEAPSNIERYGKSMFAGILFGWIDEWMRQGMPEKPEEIMLLTAQLGKQNDKVNILCRNAIESSIRQSFDGMHLNPDCLKPVLDEYGYKRTAWVLANTLHELDYDGRFSRSNKLWANRIFIPNDSRHNSEFVVRSHPAVLDGFIDLYREAEQNMEIAESEEPKFNGMTMN